MTELSLPTARQVLMTGTGNRPIGRSTGAADRRVPSVPSSSLVRRGLTKEH